MRDSHILAEGLSIFEGVVEILLRRSREQCTGMFADPIADFFDKCGVPLGVHLLSTTRVINFKFLLQPHQKYYITQYGEPGCS